MIPVKRVEPMRPIDAEPSAPRFAPPRDERVVPAFLRFGRLSLLLAVLLPFVAVSCTWLLDRLGAQPRFWLPVTAMAMLAVIGALGLGASIERRLGPVLEHLGEAQARFLDQLPPRGIPLAIAVSAGLSLFLELAVIRWLGTEWQVFALYKNFWKDVH